MHFEIRLTFKEGSKEKEVSGSERLLPLKKDLLVEIAEAAGFSGTRVYAGYREDDYTVHGGATILCVEKR